MSTTFNFQEYNAFGWKIHRKDINSGEFFYAHIGETTERKLIDNITYITKGKLQETKLDEFNYKKIHKPGDLSVELYDYLTAGKYMYTAIGKVEWWCLNYTLNRNHLPLVKSFTIKPTESKPLPKGSLLYACAGDVIISNENSTRFINTVQEVELQEDVILTSNGGFYGLIFDSRK